MKFRVSYILLLLSNYIFLNSLNGQDAIYSQTNHHQIFINPAYAGNSPYPRLMAGYRNQWPELGNSFVSYYVSYDQYFRKISGNIGICLSRDIQGNGTMSRTSGQFIYSYPLEISDNTMVSLGFQAGIVQKKVNANNLQLTDPSEIIPSRLKTFPDFAAGATFYINEQYLIGFAVHHINTPQETETGTYNYTTPMQISIQALAEITFSKPNRSARELAIYPGVYGQFQYGFNHIAIGSNFRYNKLISGLWLRTNTLFEMNTLIVQAGYTTGSLSFVYSLDAWAPKNYQQLKFYGAHEVTFISHFKYNDPKKKMKTLKCPKISR